MYWIYKRGSTTAILQKTVRIFDDLEKAGKYFLKLSEGKLEKWNFVKFYIVENGDNKPKKVNVEKLTKLFMESEVLKKEVTKYKLRMGK